jgi:N-acetylglutamate synthase-like GNAT family acetyltransferase
MLGQPMNPQNVQLRRATLDDMPKLIALWQRENLPWTILEKKFTEFQIAEDVEFLAAIGLQLSGKEAKLHSEAFTHGEQADELRARLWDRIQNLARNLGLVRIWTQLDSPFWNQSGFQPATEEGLAKLPQAFAEGNGTWRVLALKDETAAAVSIEKEFEMFKEAQREESQRLMQRARVMKMFAILVAILLVGLLILWAVFMARSNLFQRERKVRYIPTRPISPELSAFAFGTTNSSA